MAYYSRSAWTSAGKGGTRLAGSGRTMTTIFVHYPGQRSAIGRASIASTKNRLEGYRRQHKNVNGWADIAYNVAVDQSGNVWELRGIDRQSGANGGTASNRSGQAILVLVGNSEKPTAECIAGIKDAVRRIRKVHPKASRIRGHQQSPDASTACPGAKLMGLVRSGALEPGTPSSKPAPSTPARDAARPWRTSPRIAGMSASEVRRVQGLVGVTVDGKYGDRTGAAVRDFQTSIDLTADGVWGPATEAAMTTLKRIEAIVTENQKRINRIPGRVLDAPVELKGTAGTGSTTLRSKIAWAAHEHRVTQATVAKAQAAVLEAVQETGKAQGLTDEQVQAIATAAAEASARVSAEDVAEQLEVAVRNED